MNRSCAELGRIDVILSNAGCGLFGAAEELSDEQIDHMIATNPVGPFQLIRSALPQLRAQGGGRIIQLSSYGGQVAFPGNSMYHATKWGIESSTKNPLPCAWSSDPRRSTTRSRCSRSGSHASRARPSLPPRRTFRPEYDGNVTDYRAHGVAAARPAARG